MNCPKCGKSMSGDGILNTGNYIKRKLLCKNCDYPATTYEFFAQDLPNGYIASGTRVLIGDNHRDITPGIYVGTSINSLYPHLAIDDDGELQGKTIIKIAWGVREL